MVMCGCMPKDGSGRCFCCAVVCASISAAFYYATTILHVMWIAEVGRRFDAGHFNGGWWAVMIVVLVIKLSAALTATYLARKCHVVANGAKAAGGAPRAVVEMRHPDAAQVTIIDSKV